MKHQPDRGAYVLERVRRDEETGCWHWTGLLTDGGYGRVHRAYGSKAVRAHRLAYEALVGPIPAGMTIDHLCYVPDCVYPEHLEPVTLAENLARGARRRREARDRRLRAVCESVGLEYNPR